MKIVYHYLLYGFYALILAAIYGVGTYFSIYPLISQGYMLQAHIFNFVLIIISLLLDKIQYNMMIKRQNDTKLKQDKQSFIKRTLLSPNIGHISFKTSLYLFYFFVLIVSVVLQSSDFIDATDNLQNYIFTVEYGIMFLIAADMFIKHLVKDSQHILTMKGGNSHEQKEKD